MAPLDAGLPGNCPDFWAILPPAASASVSTLGSAASTFLPAATEVSTFGHFTSIIGMIAILAAAFLLSNAKKSISWQLVIWGIGLQFTFALFIFKPVWMSLTLLSLLILGTGFWKVRREKKAHIWQKMRKATIICGSTLLLLLLLFLLLPVPAGEPAGPAALYHWIYIAPVGAELFSAVNIFVLKILGFANEGTNFLISSYVTNKVESAFTNFLFTALPAIIFFSALMSVLYHLGIMQIVVKFMASIMQKTMNTSGAESMSAAANIFVGQTEAPLVVKPYVKDMTQSELMAIMTGGFATVAGGVLAGYVAILKGYFPDIAGHLMAASIMNAPAGLVLAKMIIPEVDKPKTMGGANSEVERLDANIIGAAARGAGEGMTLVLNVAAMLLAFISLIAMLNYGFKLIGLALGSSMYMLIFTAIAALFVLAFWRLAKSQKKTKLYVALGVGLFTVIWWIVFAERSAGEAGAVPLELSLEIIMGTLLKPVAWALGIAWKDATIIGSLLGEKLVINEFFAYAHLGRLLQENAAILSPRSITLATYALLGFANFSSIAIQIGGIGGIAPNRRQDLARLGIRAMIAGTLASYMTTCIAALLIP